MQADWLDFMPWNALAGGALIGFSASLLLLVNGRIAGISGILAGWVKNKGMERQWRLTFILGLLMAPIVYRWFAVLPAMQVDVELSTLVIAGLLVGFGSRLGAGCTSGHGVCGIARWSLRSLVATGLFMAAGFATVFILKHVLGA